MKIYKAKVKWNGNHYSAGEEVKGSKLIHDKEKNEWLIFDDEPIPDFPFYGEGREEWVEIDHDTLEELEVHEKDWYYWR